uniref:ATP-dependent DNA helicase n=1 Tax=Anopheles epiroticus TaxID=199890 RepID=A0A182PX41_9DIPT
MVLPRTGHLHDDLLSLITKVYSGLERFYRDPIDTLVNPEEQENLQLPPEFLNSLNISGIPVHRLRLKRYIPVLLLRNLNTDMGLCNGTRLQIIYMKANCIHARIITGKRRGDDVLLPRILCDSNDKGLPFQIRRKQFPIQPCFAMTINKSQGQSLNHVGLYLPKNVFAHGQLSNDTILNCNPQSKDDQGVFTKNIVYKQVIDT